MATLKYLKILNQGTKVWNAWRKENPTIHPNLSQANLYNEDLAGATLRRADLRGAELGRANLFQADLVGANMVGAKLIEADLRKADLSEAILRAADLRRANLEMAYFQETELVGANLMGANLTNARLFHTIFGGTNLKGVELNNCQFFGPCTLDIQTLQISDQFPLSFLRGCGLTDKFIEYLPSLLQERVIQYYSCFISYSTQDQEFAQRLHADLQDKGVRCWYAPEEMKGGEKLYDQIDSAIQVHDKLLLILSQNSMDSAWVKTEIKRTLRAENEQKKRKLFPLGLANIKTIQGWEYFDADLGEDLAGKVREYFIPDFSNWKDHDSYKQAFDRLLRDLQENVMKG